jgi:exosortase/archaeosortase family protein
MIVFLSFVLAMGPYVKPMTWFIPAGLLVIHLLNLLRVWGLFLVAVKLPEQFYFVHKYLFTSILYAVVFVLWFIWIRLTSTRPV